MESVLHQVGPWLKTEAPVEFNGFETLVVADRMKRRTYTIRDWADQQLTMGEDPCGRGISI